MDYENETELIAIASQQSLYEFLVTKDEELIDELFQAFILSSASA
jgi:hypothetical protein